MVYFLISAALFLPMMGGLLYFMRDVTDSQVDEGVGLEPRARIILDRLTGSTGVLDGGGTYWQDRADGEQGLKEAGIQDDENRLRLSRHKLENLQRGGLEWDKGTVFVDYPELKDALNVDDRFDFHLRLSPEGFDRDIDPYGVKGLRDSHIAYVGELDNPNDFDGGFTDQANNETNALKAFGLEFKPGESGFTDTVFLPERCDGGLQPVVHGTVIADADPDVTFRKPTGPSATPCLTSNDIPYLDHFLEYFWDEGNYRFDAIIFGTGVDLGRWITAAESHPNSGIDETIFLKYVEQGGTIIFLDNNGGSGGDEWVTKCEAVDNHCLFSVTGNQVPLKIPDDTNRMLYAPNVLPAFQGRGQDWAVHSKDWNDPDWNETHGFIPVHVGDPPWHHTVPDDPTEPHHLNVGLGATTSDRYGPNGGTVILSDWDLDDLEQDELSKVFSNLLNYGVLRVAYLDYGPELPEDRVVRAAAKIGVVELPNGDVLQVRMQLFLWRS